jgi:hypothetical protein
MPLDPRLLIPIALMVAGLFLFHYDFFLENSPLIRISCLFSSFLSLTIGIGWLYTVASPNPTLKILDWALIGFVLCMMPLFDALGLPPIFWIPLLVSSVIARVIITWIVKRGAGS